MCKDVTNIKMNFLKKNSISINISELLPLCKVSVDLNALKEEISFLAHAILFSKGFRNIEY